jgi:hypothetical protein
VHRDKRSKDMKGLKRHISEGGTTLRSANSRTKVVGVKVSQDEYNAFQEAARGDGTTVSTWAYRILTNKTNIREPLVNPRTVQVKEDPKERPRGLMALTEEDVYMKETERVTIRSKLMLRGTETTIMRLSQRLRMPANDIKDYVIAGGKLCELINMKEQRG